MSIQLDSGGSIEQDLGTAPGKPDLGVASPHDMGPAPQPDGGLIFEPFPEAAVGARCAGGQLSRWLVLSTTDKCGEHGQVFDAVGSPRPAAFVELQNPVAPSTQTLMATVCFQAGQCESRPMMLELDSYSEGGGAAGRWSIQLPDRRAEGVLNAQWCDFGGEGGSPAAQISLDEVAIYQGTKVALLQNGSQVNNPNAPIVAGRPGLIRVFAQPEGGFNQRELVARLTLDPGNGATPTVLQSQRRVDRGSQEDQLSSTFNFDVPGELMTTELQYSVGIYEEGGCGQGAPSSPPVFPVQGTVSMGVQSSGGPFNVVLVPVRYNADGSGRLPDISQAQVDLYHETMYGMLPVESLNVTVRQPLEWNNYIGANGSGWGTLLDEILALRSRDGVGSNVYYYGIFSPASSFGNFCGGGCVAGLGPLPTANDTYSRGSIGLGFSGRMTAETFVHETGHALGRDHAPCGVQGYGGYPHQGARLGVWGYDLVNQELKNPNDFRDVMSYCEPVWISDHHFSTFFSRIQYANQRSFVPAGTPQTYRTAIIDLDGLRWGNTVELTEAPQGDRINIQNLNAIGVVTAGGQAYGYPMTHIEGKLILVPQPPEGTHSVLIEGAGILPW